PAVGAVADHGVPDGGQVDADLVGAARLQAALDQGADRVLVLREDLVAGAGVLPGLPDGHAGAAGGGTADRGVDRAPLGLEPAPGQGQIAALDLPGGQGGHQPLVGPGRAGHHHEPAGVAVEAVDDAGPHGVAGGGDLRPAVEEPAGQRPLPVAGAGVDDEAGRLGQDDDVGVLVEDGEVDRFGPGR